MKNVRGESVSRGRLEDEPVVAQRDGRGLSRAQRLAVLAREVVAGGEVVRDGHELGREAAAEDARARVAADARERAALERAQHEDGAVGQHFGARAYAPEHHERPLPRVDLLPGAHGSRDDERRMLLRQGGLQQRLMSLRLGFLSL